MNAPHSALLCKAYFDGRNVSHEEYESYMKEHPIVPQGEPMAWMGIVTKEFLASCSDKGSIITELCKTKKEAEDVPLYTTPPSAAQAASDMRDAAVKVCRELKNERTDLMAKAAIEMCSEAIAALPIIGEQK
jgi:hypothetical protein